ncbi:hypothetical protein [Roseicyclus sp.]|uniref:hypothetical protein n=1 Tax=Roseicyclus sp. TaxID=1914329 RepID=UPI001BD02B06|nr:hypothetical protein [Roseicyclus sp.]
MAHLFVLSGNRRRQARMVIFEGRGFELIAGYTLILAAEPRLGRINRQGPACLFARPVERLTVDDTAPTDNLSIQMDRTGRALPPPQPSGGSFAFCGSRSNAMHHANPLTRRNQKPHLDGSNSPSTLILQYTLGYKNFIILQELKKHHKIVILNLLRILPLDETFLRVTLLRTTFRMGPLKGSPRKNTPRCGCE